ncbi:MAG: nuclear transport factor 2 family protein [Cognatishimia sp.]
MKLKNTIASIAVAALLPAAAIADSAESKALVLEALENTLLVGNSEAVDQYFATDYIQHNPTFGNGIEAQKGVIGFLAGNEAFKADYVRVIADDDIVAIHARYEGFGPTAMIGFDLFRVEDGKLVEHWDNLTPEAAPNPSGRTQIDGATEITDLDQTEANKALVLEFLTRALVNGEELDFTQFINPTTYLQHNSHVGDGLKTLGAFLHEMEKQGIHLKYDQVHKVIGEGNFVLALSEGTRGEKHNAFYDLFRLEGGLIVEHWDIIAPMPGTDAAHNEAGKF